MARDQGTETEEKRKEERATSKGQGVGIIQPEGLSDKKILIEMKICD